MKRPVAVVGFTLLLTLLCAAFLGFNASLALAVFLLFILVALLCIKSVRAIKWIPVVLATVTLSLGIFCIKMQLSVLPVQGLAGKQARVTATLIELPSYSNDRYSYIIKSQKIDIPGAPQKVKMLLTTDKPLGLNPYDTFTTDLNLLFPSKKGVFSSQLWNRAKGVYLNAYLVYPNQELSVTPAQSKPFHYHILMARLRVINIIESMLPAKQSGLVKSILIGDTSGLDAQTLENFRVCGVSHIFSVSGLHLSMISMLLLTFLYFLKIPRRIAALLTIIPVVGFMALIGFGASVSRSGIMMIIYLLAIILGKEADSLNSLGLAALVMGLINPFSAADVGLLLSIFATFGIVVFSNKINAVLKRPFEKLKYFRKAVHWITASVSVTVGAIVATLPITLLAFGEVSVIAPIGNLILVAPSMLVLTMGSIAVLFNFTPFISVMAYPFTLAAGILSNFVLWCSGLLARLPFAYFSVSDNFSAVWFAAVALLFATAYVMRRNFSLFRLSAILSAIMLLCGMFSYQLMMRGVTTISVFNGGGGTSVVLTRDGHSAILSCGGNTYSGIKTIGMLKKGNIKSIDLMLLADLEKKSAGCAAQVLSRCKAKMLATPKNGRYLDHINAQSKNALQRLYIGNASISLWENTNIEIIERDNNVVWLLANCNGTSILLAPEKGDVLDLPEKCRNVDILICSATLPANISRVKAKSVIVSDRHDKAALAALQITAKGVGSCKTTQEGDIVIKTRGYGEFT